MAPDRKGLSAAHIAQSVEDSLRRLHRPITLICIFPILTMQRYISRRRSGAYPTVDCRRQSRAIGASNYTAARFSQALEVSRKGGLPRYEVLEPHYNLYARSDYESELEPLCLKENIGVINYFALASGFLTGKYRTAADAAKSARGKGVVEKFLNARGLKILAALDEVAKRHRSSPASVALAWQIARPSITAPIASATTVEQLNELVAATRLNLDKSDVEQLDAASA